MKNGNTRNVEAVATVWSEEEAFVWLTRTNLVNKIWLRELDKELLARTKVLLSNRISN